jgi:hypothetical protein
MNDTADDERDVVALVERIEQDLLLVLERHTQMVADSPRYSRWVAMHSVIDLAGRLMLSAIAIEGDEARPRIAAMIDHLALLMTPASRAPH